MPVEVECTRCHRPFHASAKGKDVCPDCLEKEFRGAESQLPELQEAIRKESAVFSRRQAARAARMRKNLDASGAFSSQGRVRCALAVLLFLICAFVFMLGDSETYKTIINQLAKEEQRMISFGVCLVSAALLFPSYRRHQFIVGLSMAFILALGWFMPNIWHFRTPLALDAEPELVSEKEPPVSEPQQEEKTRLLSENDLQVFDETCRNEPRHTFYAVYIHNQDFRARDLVRDSLTRLLNAECTRAYSRGNGTLYVVERPKAGERENISGIAARYGRIYYAQPEAGVYEVQFDEEKANVSSKFSHDVLGMPNHPAFVSANLSEISCLDSMRVRAAAQRLRDSNVRVLRKDIREVLLHVLDDSWQADPDTYGALVEALVTYSQPEDREVLKACALYFNYCVETQNTMSEPVMTLLVRELPDQMAAPVVSLWSLNPLAWGKMLDSLGSRAEDPVLRLLRETQDKQLINSCLKFLEKHGTAKSVPVIEDRTSDPDSLISRSARSTLKVIQNRL